MKNIDFEIGEYGIFPEEDFHNSYKVVGLDLPHGVLIDDLTIQRYTSQLRMLVRVIGANRTIDLLNDAIAKEKAIE